MHSHVMGIYLPHYIKRYHGDCPHTVRIILDSSVAVYSLVHRCALVCTLTVVAESTSILHFTILMIRN